MVNIWVQKMKDLSDVSLLIKLSYSMSDSIFFRITGVLIKYLTV